MSDLSSRVDATANRLRLIQIELADASDGERRTELSDEIAGALKTILPERREAFLVELERRFPTWDIKPDGRTESPPRSADLPREMDDWTFLVEHLSRIAGRLSESEKGRVAARLAAAGLTPGDQLEWPREALRDVAKRLHTGEDAAIVPERTLTLLALLVEFVVGLERAIWHTWKEISPRSSIKKPDGLAKAMADFVCGGRGDSRPNLEQLQKLILGLTNAVALAGHTIAQKYLEELSPDAIRSSARRPNLLECAPAPLWERYQELAWGPDRDSIERHIRQLIAENTEKFISGLA